MLRRLPILTAAAALLAAVGLSGTAKAVDDLAAQFSITNGNPNGNWEYGTYISFAAGPASFVPWVSPTDAEIFPLGAGGILNIWREKPPTDDPNIIKKFGVTDTCCGGPITFNPDSPDELPN